jgi:hypothetical protein
MYRRPKFLEILHEIREEMSRDADYDMDLFAEFVRSGKRPNIKREIKIENEQLKIEALAADHEHLTTDN